MQKTYINLAQTSLRGGTTKQSKNKTYRLLRKLAMTGKDLPVNYVNYVIML